MRPCIHHTQRQTIRGVRRVCIHTLVIYTQAQTIDAVNRDSSAVYRTIWIIWQQDHNQIDNDRNDNVQAK